MRDKVLKKTSIERRKSSPKLETHRDLKPSHYIIEPLAYGPGWRVRFIGQYTDTGEHIELGGGIYGAHTKREELDAYRTARRRGEDWIGVASFIPDTKKFKGFPARVEQTVDQELRTMEGVHSEEYRLGMLDVVRYMMDGTWTPYRFPHGTPERDAYHAGKEHAHRRWMEVQLGSNVPVTPSEPSVSKSRWTYPKSR